MNRVKKYISVSRQAFMNHIELAKLLLFLAIYVKFTLCFPRKLINDACHAERRKSDAKKQLPLKKLFNMSVLNGRIQLDILSREGWVCNDLK